MTPLSCDQIAVIVDTEESDLEMTPGSPDHARTPLLAKLPPHDIESQVTSTKVGPHTPSVKNAQGYEQLSSADDCNVTESVISDETKMTSIVAPWKSKNNTTPGEHASSNTASAPAKSLSFENPSYADVSPSCELEWAEGIAENEASAAGGYA